MPDKLPDIFKQQIHIFDKQLEPTDEEFAKLRDFIRQSCGISLSEDKRYLITQRLSPFLKQSSSKNYLELLQKLGFDPAGSALREKVVEAMTTNETSFFRDCHPFEALRDNLLPIVAARIRASRLKPGGEHKPRLWCAASSTGQEPYSIAMLIHETFGAGAFQDIQPGSVKMLATDISSEVLARAAKGRYSSAEISRGLPDALRGKYFTKSGSDFVIDQRLRDMIEFKQLNLIKPFHSLGSFDIVFCRNVLIYFDDKTKARILDQFHDMLLPGGALLLGAMENTYCLSARFHSKRVGKTIVYERL